MEICKHTSNTLPQTARAACTLTGVATTTVSILAASSVISIGILSTPIALIIAGIAGSILTLAGVSHTWQQMGSNKPLEETEIEPVDVDVNVNPFHELDNEEPNDPTIAKEVEYDAWMRTSIRDHETERGSAASCSIDIPVEPEASIEPADTLELTRSDKLQTASNLVQWGLIGASVMGLSTSIVFPASVLAGLGSEIATFCSLPKDASWLRKALSIPVLSKWLIHYNPWVAGLFQANSLLNVARYSISKMRAAWNSAHETPGKAAIAGAVHLFNLASSTAFAAESAGLISLKPHHRGSLEKERRPSEEKTEAPKEEPSQSREEAPPLKEEPSQSREEAPPLKEEPSQSREEAPPPKEEPSQPREEAPLPQEELRQCPPKAKANLPCRNCGMFSVNLYLLGVLDRFERGTYSGVKVDFDKEGLYYDESHGPNWFEYYFRPVDVSDNNCPDAPVTTFTLQEYGDHSCYGESVYGYEQSGVTPERASYLIHKYFVVKPEIQATIDQFAKTHFSSSDHIIGVHYRGTDKTCNTDACEARRVTYEEMVSNIRKHIEKLSPTDQNRTKLFVASDEEGFIQYIKNHLSYPIVPSPSKKSIDGKPLHFNAQSPYQSGKEALQDCWWLGTLSQTLIRTSSNLGKMASLFYPEREVIEISKRNYQDKPS